MLNTRAETGANRTLHKEIELLPVSLHREEVVFLSLHLCIDMGMEETIQLLQSILANLHA